MKNNFYLKKETKQRLDSFSKSCNFSSIKFADALLNDGLDVAYKIIKRKQKEMNK